jgi:hypothetical protein
MRGTAQGYAALQQVCEFFFLRRGVRAWFGNETDERQELTVMFANEDSIIAIYQGDNPQEGEFAVVGVATLWRYKN